MPMTAQRSATRSASAVATITALLPNGQQVARELVEGDSVVVGSLEGCDVQLQVEGVAGTHCILGVDDGTVWLRDCYSPSGTFVDDRRVSETRLQQSASLRVGECDLSLHLHATATVHDDLNELGLERPNWQHELEAEIDPSVAATPSEAVLSTQGDEGQPAQQVDRQLAELRELLEQAHGEIGCLQEQLKQYQQREPFSISSALSPQADPFQEELIELLRSEVTELQKELAERDARLEEVQASAKRAPTDETGVVSQEELEVLVARLEELLAELQRKEEHTGLLEEMLRASEDANRAEQEERFQLEAWVRDIEQRVGDREAEWQAHVEKLEKTIDEQAEQRGRLEQSLAEALSGSHAAAVHQELTGELRREIAELKASLEASEQRRNELQQQLSSRPPEIDPATREQQAEIARERAELARQRAALEAMRQTSERPHPTPPPAPDGMEPRTPMPPSSATLQRASDADERIRALRQHLSQTSDDDEAQEEQPATLASRIARLWRKLESSQ